MQNGLFVTNWKVVGQSVISAVVFAVLAAAVTLVGNGFDLWSADWVTVFHNMVNIGFTAGIVTLGNDLLSTKEGSLLGVGPNIGSKK